MSTEHQQVVDPAAQWKSCEILRGKQPFYPVEIQIPEKSGDRTVHALVTSKEIFPGFANIVIPLTSRALWHQRDEDYTKIFNEFCRFNQASLDIAEAKGIETAAMEAIGINYRNVRPFDLAPNWGRNPKENPVNAVGFTSSLNISGSPATWGEFFGFPIKYIPLKRSQMLIRDVTAILEWRISPISAS